MRAIVALCAVLVLCASAHALAGKDLHQKLRAKQQHLKADADTKWDIYGDYHAKYASGKCKDKLHEQIANEALDHLAARRNPNGPLYTTSGKFGDTAVNVNGIWRGNELKTGVRWNDMPTGNKNDFLNLYDFKNDFEAHVDTDAVSASHYGCLQHIHGMAPVVQGAPHPVLFTNAEVKTLISAQMEFWWNKALDALFFLPPGATPGTAAAFAPKAKTYSHYIGHILHTFGDAYAPAHVVRGYMTRWNGAPHGDVPVPSFVGVPAQLEQVVPSCGKVITFQGYGAQDSELHGETDHSTDGRCQAHDGCQKRADSAVRARLVECSTAANYQILDAFTDCVVAHAQNELNQRPHGVVYQVGVRASNACSFASKLAPLINTHFELSAPLELAGGSVRAFVAPNNRANPAYADTEIVYTDVVGDLHKAHDDHVLVPIAGYNGAVLWSAQPHHPAINAVKLCTNVQARTGWKASVKMPFTEFANVDNSGHDHMVHAPGVRPDGFQI